MSARKTYVECACGSAEHTIRFIYFDDDADEMYLEVHLTPHRFMRRLWHAIKYMFGYRCAYGDFQEVVLNKESVEQLVVECNQFLGFNYEQNRKSREQEEIRRPI